MIIIKASAFRQNIKKYLDHATEGEEIFILRNKKIFKLKLCKRKEQPKKINYHEKNNGETKQ